MKKVLFVLIAFLGLIFTANAQSSGRYRANNDLSSLNISKGEIVYISFTANAISFENTTNMTSFIATCTGGMAGFTHGFNWRFYYINDKHKNVQIKFNDKTVIVYNCTFTKL